MKDKGQETKRGVKGMKKGGRNERWEGDQEEEKRNDGEKEKHRKVRK